MANRTGTPHEVSLLLAAAVEFVGARRCDADCAAELCVADRKFLLLRLGQLLNGDHVWVHPTCEQCGIVFDVGFARSDLPIKTAGSGFPIANVPLVRGVLSVRVPTGADQEAIADRPEDEAMRELLRRCLRMPTGEPVPEDLLDALDDHECKAIEDAVDAMAPDVGTRFTVDCPECRYGQVSELDLLADVGWGATGLLEDVHQMATHYHWSEDAILNLPRHRRRMYLQLIDGARGVYA